MSRRADKVRSRVVHSTLTCKPLENILELGTFLEDPPAWRTLCKELTPRSNFVIRNMEHRNLCEPELELPETYCHFDPDTEPPVRYNINRKKLPKTLVCHDMANGYHDDSKIDGTQRYDAYTFYNWAGIDIFCYFSHHLVTIPPLCWINVGHEHGVKVIGTVITERTEGTILWDIILGEEAHYQDFAGALVVIAKTLKFDGWLLNIENKITNPEKLIEFVGYLHKTLHEELEDPVLIWYDSVTTNGNLNWQNGLNSKNRPFFDLCDGFFTNYSWTIKDLEDTAKEAGDRITDVYIGIDIWGRNFFGGGQFNVQTAVKEAYKTGCSLALFAPAWTHEAIHEARGSDVTMPEISTVFEQFVLRDRALWGSLWPYLNTHLPCKLPFKTSFCRGQGKRRWMYGEVISPGPWFNLRHQQYQPNSAHGPHGYVLSSMEKLLKVSFIRKEKKGIIKYRKDLDNLRLAHGAHSSDSDMYKDQDADDDFDDTLSMHVKESAIKFKDQPEFGPEQKPENVAAEEKNEKEPEPNVEGTGQAVKEAEPRGQEAEQPVKTASNTVTDGKGRSCDVQADKPTGYMKVLCKCKEILFKKHKKVKDPTSADNPSCPPVKGRSVGQEKIGQQTTGQVKSGQQTTGQEKIGQEKSGQEKIGQQTTVQEKSGPEKIGQQTTGQENIGQEKSGQENIGQQTTGQEKSGQEKISQEKISQETIDQETTGQETTGQETARQETARQETTGQKTTDQKTTGQETTRRQAASQETTSQETTSQGTTSQETASQETASQGTASQETASQGTASLDTSSQQEPTTVDATKEEVKKNVDDDELETEGEISGISGRSMAAMSVNLNLNIDSSKTRWTLGHVPMERECLALYLEDAFNGGACLKINPSDRISTDHRTIRLFHCDFTCTDTLIVCVVTKTIMQYAQQSLNIKLFMKNSKDQDLTVVLMEKSLGLSESLTETSRGIVYCYPVNSEQESFIELRRYLLVNEPNFYVPLENLYGWTVRYHILNVPGSRLTEVNCRTTQPHGSILLGQLGICHRKINTESKLLITQQDQEKQLFSP